MDKHTAADLLDNLVGMVSDTQGNDYDTALRMGVEALKTERHGRWIFGTTMGHSWMKCSECCKCQSGQTACFTYCPNCGVRMDGEQDG